MLLLVVSKMLVNGKFNYSFKNLELPHGSTERINELIDLFMQVGAVEPWSECPFVPPGIFDGEMSFFKEVGFINAAQVPSNDGDALLCYVLTDKCLDVSPAIVSLNFAKSVPLCQNHGHP